MPWAGHVCENHAQRSWQSSRCPCRATKSGPQFFIDCRRLAIWDQIRVALVIRNLHTRIKLLARQTSQILCTFRSIVTTNPPRDQALSRNFDHQRFHNQLIHNTINRLSKFFFRDRFLSSSSPDLSPTSRRSGSQFTACLYTNTIRVRCNIQNRVRQMNLLDKGVEYP